MGKNYPIDRDKKGRYRHSFVFMRGSEVTVKLLGSNEIFKGIVSTIERYYLVLDIKKENEIEQVTLNLGAIKYIKHNQFPTVEERSLKEDSEDTNTTFIFSEGEQIKCAFRDGKGIKGKLLSEDDYYFYIKTEKGSYITVMKNTVDYIIHSKHDPALLVGDFYTEEMKAGDYKKPTEYVFSVGNIISFVFYSGKELSGEVMDESKYWVLLNIGKSQVTVLKGSYSYIKHGVFDNKANLYVENKNLKKSLRRPNS